MPRSQHNWTCRPGSFDTLNTRFIYEADNAYGLPELKAVQEQDLPDLVLPFNYVTQQHQRAIVHTFIEDYQLERVWKKPERYIRHLAADVFVAPDFSLYIDYPIALQIFNIYRSRWVGRFLQEYGTTVIPSASWSDKNSFDFCFKGIPKHATVAISSTGIRRKETTAFMLGVEELLRQTEPKTLICYGLTKKTELDSVHNNIKYLATFTQGIRERAKKKNDT